MSPATSVQAALSFGDVSSWDVNKPNFLGLYLSQAVAGVKPEPQSSGIRICLFYLRFHTDCEVVKYHPHPSAQAHTEVLPARVIFHLDARTTCLTSLATGPLPVYQRRLSCPFRGAVGGGGEWEVSWR